MKESSKKLYDCYDYARIVPLKGLFIDGKPALTGASFRRASAIT